MILSCLVCLSLNFHKYGQFLVKFEMVKNTSAKILLKSVPDNWQDSYTLF